MFLCRLGHRSVNAQLPIRAYSLLSKQLLLIAPILTLNVWKWFLHCFHHFFLLSHYLRLICISIIARTQSQVQHTANYPAHSRLSGQLQCNSNVLRRAQISSVRSMFHNKLIKAGSNYFKNMLKHLRASTLHNHVAVTMNHIKVTHQSHFLILPHQK